MNLLKKPKYGKPIIVVSGLPRSGTSMMMKMLEAGGVEIASDGERKADDDNPKGYYELERIKELDKGKDKSWVKNLRGKAVKVISFLLKDLPGEHFYKVIFVRRDLKEVMASQNKMLVNRGVDFDPSYEKKMIANYEKHLHQVEQILKGDDRFDVLYLSHREILNDPLTSAKAISSFVQDGLNEKAMAGVVDTALYRNRNGVI
ncbi:MAG: sulfotransferase family protein [Deltaproteobacteria bacterium]|nr:sulfotransferase family protein [Deltaproteobacteria bacterium]